MSEANPEQQWRNRELIERHIIWCQTMTVEALIRAGEIDLDRDAENLFYNENDYEVQEGFSEAGDMKEVYEWYLVSDWFATKLAEKGEVIVRYGLSTWWGRQATGQAVYLDPVITEIERGE